MSSKKKPSLKISKPTNLVMSTIGLPRPDRDRKLKANYSKIFCENFSLDITYDTPEIDSKELLCLFGSDFSRFPTFLLTSKKDVSAFVEQFKNFGNGILDLHKRATDAKDYNVTVIPFTRDFFKMTSEISALTIKGTQPNGNFVSIGILPDQLCQNIDTQEILNGYIPVKVNDLPDGFPLDLSISLFMPKTSKYLLINKNRQSVYKSQIQTFLKGKAFSEIYVPESEMKTLMFVLRVAEIQRSLTHKKDAA